MSKQSITVIAVNQEKVYGQQDPEFALEDINFNKLSSERVRELQITLSRQVGEKVGGYQIVGSSPDPRVNVLPGYFMIRPLPNFDDAKTINIAIADQQMTYGDAIFPKLQVRLSHDTKPDQTLTTTDLEVVDQQQNIVQPSDVQAGGTYMIQLKKDVLAVFLAQHEDYQTASFNVGILTVNKQPLTVHIENQEKEYGTPDPVFKLENQDLNHQLVVNMSRLPGEKLGQYQITGNSKNQNYAVTVIPGKFTIIKPATPTAQHTPIHINDVVRSVGAPQADFVVLVSDELKAVKLTAADYVVTRETPEGNTVFYPHRVSTSGQYKIHLNQAGRQKYIKANPDKTLMPTDFGTGTLMVLPKSHPQQTSLTAQVSQQTDNGQVIIDRAADGNVNWIMNRADPNNVVLSLINHLTGEVSVYTVAAGVLEAQAVVIAPRWTVTINPDSVDQQQISNDYPNGVMSFSHETAAGVVKTTQITQSGVIRDQQTTKNDANLAPVDQAVDDLDGGTTRIKVDTKYLDVVKVWLNQDTTHLILDLKRQSLVVSETVAGEKPGTPQVIRENQVGHFGPTTVYHEHGLVTLSRRAAGERQGQNFIETIDRKAQVTYRYSKQSGQRKLAPIKSVTLLARLADELKLIGHKLINWLNHSQLSK